MTPPMTLAMVRATQKARRTALKRYEYTRSDRERKNGVIVGFIKILVKLLSNYRSKNVGMLVFRCDTTETMRSRDAVLYQPHILYKYTIFRSFHITPVTRQYRDNALMFNFRAVIAPFARSICPASSCLILNEVCVFCRAELPTTLCTTSRKILFQYYSTIILPLF
jgi:hypothetical protein